MTAPVASSDATFAAPAAAPAAAGRGARRLRKDLRVLAKFTAVYCKHVHRDAEKAPFALKTHDLAAILGRPPLLCAACRKLLAHAFVKRTACPYDPKPMCKHCPTHCYAPNYRAAMREVMKYSGRRLLLTGRLDYAWHYFF